MELNLHICKPILIFLVAVNILKQTKATPTYVLSDCDYDTGNYTQNSIYQESLNVLLTNLTTYAVNASYYSSAFGVSPNRVYGRFYCRADINPAVCSECVQAAAQRIVGDKDCPKQMVAVIFYDVCTLDYSNQALVFHDYNEYGALWSSGINFSNPDQSAKIVQATMNSLMKQAAYGNNSHQYFATKEAELSSGQTLYNLVQCIPNVTAADCFRCLQLSLSGLQEHNQLKRKWAMYFYQSCQIRYDLSLFYDLSLVLPSPPPPSAPSVPNRHQSPPLHPTLDSSGTGKSIVYYVTRIAAPVAGSLLLLGLCICCLYWMKRHHTSSTDTQGGKEELERGGQNTKQFRLNAMKHATGNFSSENILGEGGFGIVYKGMLQNGQEVAIKRLSEGTKQGVKEFTSEVILVAKLQHRNLVELIGSCAEGEERLIIYEFIPNLSLDRFLFDPSKSKGLNWGARFKIILGIARGIHYLHEESRFPVVHRDLKSSNILLDEEMMPKIADFGLARLVKMDHTQVKTTRVIGTLGYMAPEYAMAGHFSVKSDVYSFGVIILEIVSGQSNNKIQQEGLLLRFMASHAWRLWNEGVVEKLLDPVIRSSDATRIEAERCVQIALLCVQDDPTERPTMQDVIFMLNSSLVNLVSPSTPPRNNFNIPLPTNPPREYQQYSAETGGSTSLYSMDKDLYPR